MSICSGHHSSATKLKLLDTIIFVVRGAWVCEDLGFIFNYLLSISILSKSNKNMKTFYINYSNKTNKNCHKCKWMSVDMGGRLVCLNRYTCINNSKIVEKDDQDRK